MCQLENVGAPVAACYVLVCRQWFGRRSNPYNLGFNQVLYRLSYRTIGFDLRCPRFNLLLMNQPTKKPSAGNTGL